MAVNPNFEQPHFDAIDHAVDLAIRAIPPVWPLASSVAVNPFLGQASATLPQTAARLARVCGASVTMPRSWYNAQIASGTITDADLLDAWANAPEELRPTDLTALKTAAAKVLPRERALPTIADLAFEASGFDWPGLIADRFSAWAAGYFDQGQALWAAPRDGTAYAAWRALAVHDLTPEIAGLSGFAAFVLDASENARNAIRHIVQRLNLSIEATETYFHQMLMTLGGWAQYARYKLWQTELRGESDQTISDFLAIRLIWEEALFNQYERQISGKWSEVQAKHAASVAPTSDFVTDAILQEASERASQRVLAAKLAQPSMENTRNRPTVQAAFCIDVRSEIFRRSLELVNPAIQTLGFAGFFGLAISHRRFASDVDELRLPVLLNPSFQSRSGDQELMALDQSKRFKARAKRAWGRFKLAAVSSFAFVEAMGPVYAGKLLRDAIGAHTSTIPDDPTPRLDRALDLAMRINTAEAILRAMSLTRSFAPLVLLIGHGANVVNNPHASALHCGACGGYSGEANARLLATLLNEPEIRKGLKEREIEIPADTLFLAALHDTTTDHVSIYEKDADANSHHQILKRVRAWLISAGTIARSERALRLPRAAKESAIVRRSRDWSEIRPEWALAGCKAFIAAPRARTSGKNLEGRVFLHDYDWRQDKGFGVLELIMTAPVVVASWISLQYYGSTVAPDVFGSGNKVLHNVVGGVGVLEGNSGPLRPGLPWQSVHDGEHYVHEPLRLSVCIEAPCEAITDILARHEGVRALFDNRWLHLFALDDEGQMAWRYAGDLQWTALSRISATTRRMSVSV